MSTVTQEQIDKLDEKIIVTLKQEDYSSEYEKNLKQYAKSAQLKGFKKGKVPKPLVQKMYGRSLLADQLMRQAYGEANTYIRDKDIKIFAQPMLTDMPEIPEAVDLTKDYTFQFEIGLRPTFEIPMLDGTHTATQMQVEATDEMVEDDIDRLQNRTGEMTEPETVEEENTVLNVTLQEVDADGNAVEGVEPVEDSFLISYLNEPVRKDFMGKKIGDTVTLSFEDAFSDKLAKPMAKDLGIDGEDAESRKKTYQMTIDKIGAIKKSPLDEEFYNKIFPNEEIKTEEEFRAKIKSDIQNQWDEAAVNVLDNSLYEQLIHETEIDFPEDFLKKWLKFKEEQPLSDEEVAVAYPSFEHQLKWTVISDKIIEDNEIKVEQEEVKETIKQQVLGYFGASSDMQEPWLDDFINKSVNDPEQYQKTANEIMAKKVLAVVRSKMKLETEAVTPDEFRTRSEEAAHKYHNHD